MTRRTWMILSAVACMAGVVGLLAWKGVDMGFLGSWFGKRASVSPKVEPSFANLALVLLPEARLPDAETVMADFRDFAVAGEELRRERDASEGGESGQVLLLALNTGEWSVVALMPAAVPNGEAESNVEFSLSSFRDSCEIPPHSAHLAVTFHAMPDTDPIVRLSRFTSLLAAVTKASQAVGVYWGNAGATHAADFFLRVASEQGVTPRMMLWSGMSVAREANGRISLLSLGMGQLDLPDLLLTAGAGSEMDAVAYMYDLLAYVAERGEPLPEGDTVGRTADERLPVRYVRSPIDGHKKVWRVELP